jgi:transposase
LKVIARACQKPDNITRWSTRDLAAALKKENIQISKSTVNRILMETDLKPHKIEMWLTSKDRNSTKSAHRWWVIHKSLAIHLKNLHIFDLGVT